MNKITLRDWQLEARDLAVNSYTAGNKTFLTHATPGGGKTIHGLSVFDEMVNSGSVSHVVVLAPTTALVKQWAKDAKKFYGIELKPELLNNYAADFHEYHGMIMTYAGMNSNCESLRKFCSENSVLVIADEIHHVSDEQCWGGSFRKAFDPCLHILALTGTPWGSDGKRIAFIEYDDSGNAVPDFSYDKKTAIRDKVCRVTTFMGRSAKDLVFVDEDTGQILATYPTLDEALEAEEPRAYSKTLGSVKHMGEIFADADEQLTRLRANIPDAGGLIVASGIQVANEFRDQLKLMTGEDYPVVHSNESQVQQKIADFEKGHTKWLISVDMITEGVDIKRLMVCVFLSAKNTELFVRQVAGRIERVRYPGKISDETGYFYYTNQSDLDVVVSKIAADNEAGVALKEEAESKEAGDRTVKEKEEDYRKLLSVRTEQETLMAAGYSYDADVVAEALELQRSATHCHEFPLRFHCMWIMDDRERKEKMAAQVPKNEYDELPLAEKKERLRSVVSKELNRKLARHTHGNLTGDMIRRAHYFINSRIGVKQTDADISLEQLEKKRQIISETEASTWLK